MADYLNIARRAVRPPQESNQTPGLEDVLRGVAIELWSNSTGQLFIVADEEDAKKLRMPRGVVYTAAELRRIVRISDPAVVREIHEWKHRFDGVVRETRK